MLFGFWQLKTTVFALLLASSFGHQLLRTCQRDYCYERSIERQDIEADNLRKLYGEEGRRADTTREIRNLDNISRGLRENRLDQFNSESNREIRRELKTLSENRRELARHEPSRREPYRNLIEVDNSRSKATEVLKDFNRHVEQVGIQRSAILERRQETNTDRFRTPTSRLNERENRRNRNDLRDENQELQRFNDRISMKTAEREIIDRQSRLSSDRIFESDRKLLERRERNSEERVNREFSRSDEQTTDRHPEPVQRRHQIEEEINAINEVLTRREHENNRDVARRESENSETRRFSERHSERDNEIRFENLRRERENNASMDKSRRLSLTEGDLLDKYDSRLDERERNNHRSIEHRSERTQESIQRREGNGQERDNRLKEVQRSSSRLDLTEPLTEQRANLRRLNKRESLDENHRSIEQLSGRNREGLQRGEMTRRERTENREFERSNSRLSAERRLTEHENERSNEHLSNLGDRNERQRDENRESRKSSQRIIEREERNVQRRMANNMECERNTERNVRDNENRRVTSRQDNREQRYDINNRRTEREFTQRRVGDTRNRENNSRQQGITQQDKRLEVFNRRGEQRSVVDFNRRQQHRFANSPEREIVLNRNRDSQRSSDILTESDEKSFENRSENYREHVDSIRSSRRSEQRHNYRQADRNQNSRRINERRDENGLLNSFSRRSSFTGNERESVEQRLEELRELAERVDQRQINRASDRSADEIQRSRLRIFENVENIRERDNHNLDERKLQHETNRRLESRRSNERQERIESTRNNHEMVLRKGEATKLQQRRDENKRQQREKRENQRLDSLSYRNVENRRVFQFIVDEHKETPTDSVKNNNIAYVQGVLLAIVIMKTLNGKNNIKCHVSQKLQEAIAMLGF